LVFRNESRGCGNHRRTGSARPASAASTALRASLSRPLSTLSGRWRFSKADAATATSLLCPVPPR
jgi:hypothetical protein